MVTESSFEDLYRRELRAIVAVATTLTGSPEVGRDLAHEAMLRAYRDWERVGALDRPGAWVRRVVINLATDYHRRRSRELRALARFGPPTALELTDPTSGRFWAAVRALPERQRAAVTLRYACDLAHREVAAALGCSEEAARRSAHEGLKRLKEAVPR